LGRPMPSIQAMEPPPAEMVDMSSAGMSICRRAITPSVTSSGAPPSMKAMSAEVPPISRVTRPLSDSLRRLGGMGVRVRAERPYGIRPDGAESMWIHDFELEAPAADELDIDALAPLADLPVREVTIDGLMLEVESDIERLLLLQAPVAGDLRYALAALVLAGILAAGAEWLARAETPPLTGGPAISVALWGAGAGLVLCLHMAFGPGMTTILTGADTCYSCAVKCKRVVTTEFDGRRVEPRHGGPEYETPATVGSYCGVDSPPSTPPANPICHARGPELVHLILHQRDQR